ncbi:MAG: Ig-like domain-containing protein [Thermoproteota archaeon]
MLPSTRASVTFTVSVEDSGSGIKEVRLTVDGVSQGTMTSGSDYSKALSLSEGSHTWSVEAVDNVGNNITKDYTITLTSPSMWDSAVIIVVAAVIVVAILNAVLLLKRRRPLPPPPA